MSPKKPAVAPAGPVSVWLDAAVASGAAGTYGDPLRSAIFDAVQEDRDGPVAQRLLVLASDPDVEVRRTVVRLLFDLTPTPAGWPRAAEAAADRLTDEDEHVRRAAAWLLFCAGGIARAAAVLRDERHPADPIARTALAEAALSRFVTSAEEARRELAECLRDDRDPAVRLIASLASLTEAAPADRAGIEAAIRADLPAGAGRLAGEGGVTGRGAGDRWASALARHDLEEDCFLRVAELLDGAQSAVVRRTGIEMAGESMREWRAAPDRLTHLIVPLLTGSPMEVRVAAAETLAESLTATGLAAEHLAEVLDVPGPGAPAAVGLARIGDVRALPALCRILRGDPRTWPYGLGEAVDRIAGTDADYTVLIGTLLEALARDPEHCVQGRVCPALLAAVGLARLGARAATAVPDLVMSLRAAIDRADHDHPASGLVRALGSIGPAAAPAVPLLETLLSGKESAAEAAVLALVRITGDRRYAEAYLDAVPEDARYCGIGPDLLGWLMDQGELSGRRSTQLHRFFDRPGPMQIRTAHLVWRHDGWAMPERLLEVLPRYLEDDVYAPYGLKTLTAMGAAARPVVPALDAIISRRRRLPFYIGNFGAEMRADERLVTRVREARDLITGGGREVGHA
jgi:hypothetical protein